MPDFELFGLIALAFIAWLWYDSLKARDAGMGAVRAVCAAEGLQLLDDTVAIAGLKPERNDEGRLVLRRVYEFEYSDTGNDRRHGSVVLHGHRVIVLNVGLHGVSADRTLH